MFVNVNYTYYICVHPCGNEPLLERSFQQPLITKKTVHFLHRLKCPKKIHLENRQNGVAQITNQKETRK